MLPSMIVKQDKHVAYVILRCYEDKYLAHLHNDEQKLVGYTTVIQLVTRL